MRIRERRVTGAVTLSPGHRIGYEIYNDDKCLPTIVLLNGSLFNYRQWDLIVRAGFRKVAWGDYRIIRYDYGGTGRSELQPFAWDIFKLGDELRAFLDKIDQSKVILYGLSKGTIVAQIFASRYPERVSAIGGYGWFHLGYSGMVEVERFFSERLAHFHDLAAIERSPLSHVQFDMLWQRVSTHVLASRRSKIPDWLGLVVEKFLKRKVYGLLEPTPARTMYEWFAYAVAMMNQAPAYFDQVKPALAKFPLVIQHAKRDGTLPFKMAEELHRVLPNSSIQEFGRGYNHISVTLSPLQAYTIVRDFIGAIATVRSR